MPNKLTDTDVKKALECAIRNDCDCNCVFLLPNKVQDVLDLINRLQAENEKFDRTVKEYAYLYDKHINTPFSHIKAEAYKEFFAKAGEIIIEIYNKHIFGSNDLTGEEKDAIINFSDDVTYKLDNLLKELGGKNESKN